MYREQTAHVPHNKFNQNKALISDMKFHSWHGSRHAIALNNLVTIHANKTMPHNCPSIKPCTVDITSATNAILVAVFGLRLRFYIAHWNSYWFIRIRHPNVQNACANTKKCLQFATTKPKFKTSWICFERPSFHRNYQTHPICPCNENAYLHRETNTCSWHFVRTFRIVGTHIFIIPVLKPCANTVYIQILAFATELGFVCIVLQHWKKWLVETHEIQKCVSSKMPIHSIVWRVLKTPQNHKEYLHSLLQVSCQRHAPESHNIKGSCWSTPTYVKPRIDKKGRSWKTSNVDFHAKTKNEKPFTQKTLDLQNSLVPKTRLDDMRTEKQNSWHHSDNASFFSSCCGEQSTKLFGWNGFPTRGKRVWSNGPKRKRSDRPEETGWDKDKVGILVSS